MLRKNSNPESRVLGLCNVTIIILALKKVGFRDFHKIALFDGGQTSASGYRLLTIKRLNTNDIIGFKA